MKKKKRKGTLWKDGDGNVFLCVDKKWFRMIEGQNAELASQVTNSKGHFDGFVLADSGLPSELRKFATVTLSTLPKKTEFDA